MDETPTERLRLMAGILADCTVTDQYGSEQVLLDEELVEIADAIDNTDPVTVTLALCGRHGPVKGLACDRPARHDGDCSWHAVILRRRNMEEHDYQIRRTAAYEKTVKAQRRELIKTKAALAFEQSHRRFRKKRKPDRG